MKILLKVGGILVMPIEDQLTQIIQTGQNTWESKNILAVSFAPLVQPSKNDNGTPDSVGLPPCAVRNLQDLARISLRNFVSDEMQAKGIPQRAPPKRKGKRVKQRINTYIFVGNQLIPQPLDSEEDEKMEEDSKEEEEKDHSKSHEA